MVVHGMEGLDEISLCGPTKVAELRHGEVKEYTLEPEKLSFKIYPLEALHAGSATESAAIIKRVFQGEKGPARDVVLLNSGAALYVSGKAETFEHAIRVAADSIDSGKARQKLEHLAHLTNAG